jgi:phosphohistidine phosphatase
MVQCGMGVRLTPALRSRRPGRADWGVSRKRTLYLLRHAKSSWDDPALPDRDRPLAPRGYRACELVAEHLRRHKITPALVLCSSSTRTRETLERVSVGFSRPVDALIEDGLYAATAAELLARLRTVDSAVTSVLLIGHQPAVQELAVSLVVAAERRGVLNGKFPTGALATLALPSSWAALAPETAMLTAFVKPRELKAGRKPDAA